MLVRGYADGSGFVHGAGTTIWTGVLVLADNVCDEYRDTVCSDVNYDAVGGFEFGDAGSFDCCRSMQRGRRESAKKSDMGAVPGLRRKRRIRNGLDRAAADGSCRKWSECKFERTNESWSGAGDGDGFIHTGRFEFSEDAGNGGTASVE